MLKRISHVHVFVAILFSGIVGIYLIASDPKLSGKPIIEQSNEASRLFEVSRPIFGANDSKITIFEFMDYECPPCRVFAPTLESIGSENSDVQIRIVNFPLKMHKLAPLFAQQAMLSSDIDFPTLHSKLLKEPLSVSQAEAMRASLGVEKLNSHQNAEIQTKIKRSIQVAKLYGVESTPTVFVYSARNSKLYLVVDRSKLGNIIKDLRSD